MAKKRRRKNKKKALSVFISIAEIVAGVSLLAFEIVRYVTLDTFYDDSLKSDGFYDFTTYREDVFNEMFLWLILFLAGVSFWKSRVLHWALTEVFVVAFFTVLSLKLSWMAFGFGTISIPHVLWMILAAVSFVVVQSLMSRNAKRLGGITPTTVVVSVVFGVIVVAIYYFIGS